MEQNDTQETPNVLVSLLTGFAGKLDQVATAARKQVKLAFNMARTALEAAEQPDLIASYVARDILPSDFIGTFNEEDAPVIRAMLSAANRNISSKTKDKAEQAALNTIEQNLDRFAGVVAGQLYLTEENRATYGITYDEICGRTDDSKATGTRDIIKIDNRVRAAIWPTAALTVAQMQDQLGKNTRAKIKSLGIPAAASIEALEGVIAELRTKVTAASAATQAQADAAVEAANAAV